MEEFEDLLWIGHIFHFLYFLKILICTGNYPKESILHTSGSCFLSHFLQSSALIALIFPYLKAKELHQSSSLGQVDFAWQDNSRDANASANDKVLLIVFNPAKQQAITIIGGYDRSVGAQAIEVPSTFAGDEVRCFKIEEHVPKSRNPKFLPIFHVSLNSIFWHWIQSFWLEDKLRQKSFVDQGQDL